MRIASLSADMRLSALAGLQVWDWSRPAVRDYVARSMFLPATFRLRYDEMYVARQMNGLLVGEEAHFVWRMQQLAANKLCRQEAARHIQATATRILGEHWELSE